MKKKTILLTTIFTLAMSVTAFADPSETVPAETEVAAESSEALPEESAGETVPAETTEETVPAELPVSDEYCHIKVVAKFADDVDPEEFPGFKMIFTPVDLSYYYDTGRIPEELKLENKTDIRDESYEDYELTISHINDFEADLDISGLRAVNVQCTESNILKQDTHFYIPYGDDIITVDMTDIDPSGFYAGESYFIRNEPGTQKTIYVTVSENPNPKKPDINDVEITDEIKTITDMAMDDKSDDEINVKYENIETIQTNEERIMNALPVIIGLVIVIGIGVGGYLYIRKVRNEEDDD